VYARVFAELGVHRTAREFDAAMRSAWTELERRLPRGVNRYGSYPAEEERYWKGFVREVVRRLDPPVLEPNLASRALPRLRNAFRDPRAWNVWPEVPGALDALAAHRVVLGVVSNWDSRLPALLGALGLRDRFDTIAVSALEGVEKPDPGIFRIALDRLGVPPERALHVGDHPDLDVRGALEAGIDAALLDRSGRAGAMRNLSALPRLAVHGSAPGVRLKSAPRPA
jgi:putative hydrolase of the HAD superfamily